MKFLYLMILSLLALGSEAQNLVQNGHFDQGIDGWDNSNNNISWISDDGPTNQGVLEVSDNFNNGGLATVANLTHIEVQDGVTYEISAAVKVMPNTEAQGATLLIYWLDENEQYVGYTDYVYSDPDVTDGTWHEISDRFTPPQDMKYARVLVSVNNSSSGSSDYATARWDDVRFSIADAEHFSIVAAHSGSWYDLQQSGHGLNIEVLDNNQVLVFWYVYNAQGTPIWLFASGTHNGTEIMIDANMATGAMFPPNFNPQDVTLTPWGQFYIKFTGCNAGIFRWTPVAGSTFAAGEMNITRLTQIKGLQCAE